MFEEKMLKQGTSTVQKECKRISPNFGYCSTEKSPKFQAKFRELSAEISSKFR